MQRINYWLRNVFGFSQREISGFRILTIILVLAVVAPFLVGLVPAEKSAQIEADRQKLDSLTAVLEASSKNIVLTEGNPAISNNITLTDFDPNEFSFEQWQAVGVQKSIAQRIINYRQKGGRFKVKTDLLKIYGFPAGVYSQLAPFILLPDTVVYERKGYANTSKAKEEKMDIIPVKAEKAKLSFDLNVADSIQLVQVKGIGPGLSRRIINYRKKLGGFYSVAQLREVYGLDSVVVDELLNYGFVQINPTIIKLPVNTATAQELDAHPYISPKVASIIVDYRKQHGNYTSLESLYQIRALDKVTLDKLAPYLSFE